MKTLIFMELGGKDNKFLFLLEKSKIKMSLCAF